MQCVWTVLLVASRRIPFVHSLQAFSTNAGMCNSVRVYACVITATYFSILHVFFFVLLFFFFFFFKQQQQKKERCWNFNLLSTTGNRCISVHCTICVSDASTVFELHVHVCVCVVCVRTSETMYMNYYSIIFFISKGIHMFVACTPTYITSQSAVPKPDWLLAATLTNRISEARGQHKNIHSPCARAAIAFRSPK